MIITIIYNDSDNNIFRLLQNDVTVSVEYELHFHFSLQFTHKPTEMSELQISCIHLAKENGEQVTISVSIIFIYA